ncbi:uncharacterized protein CEXT_762921 [Caerostris extrusa]|uniref:Polyamine-modulated factor 1 n=1 Tax=Caerostris extrusa TaxID=172846 RepID=A0AAV4PPK3_CAEEX|nr:uncharacterized protein CEXT_762921 [Caerostris extrusa]
METEIVKLKSKKYCKMSVSKNPEEIPKDKSDSHDNHESRLKSYFQQAISHTLDRFLSYFKFSMLKTRYPGVGKEELQEIHKQLKNQLKESVTKDVNNICEQTNVFSSLNLLDDLIKKQSKRKDEEAWRPSGVPEEDLRDHVHHVKQKHKKCLEFVLQTLRAENELLEETANKNHSMILELKTEVDTVNQEVQENFAVLNDVEKTNKDILTEITNQMDPY